MFVETRIHQFNCHYQRATLHAANLGCLFKQTIQRLSIAELDNINDRRNTQTNTEWSKKTAQRPGILLERQSMKTFQEKCCQSSYKNVAVHMILFVITLLSPDDVFASKVIILWNRLLYFNTKECKLKVLLFFKVEPHYYWTFEMYHLCSLHV